MKILLIVLALALLPITAHARDKYRSRDSYGDSKRSDQTYQQDRRNLRRYMGMELDYGKRREMERQEKSHSKRRK